MKGKFTLVIKTKCYLIWNKKTITSGKWKRRFKEEIRRVRGKKNRINKQSKSYRNLYLTIQKIQLDNQLKALEKRNKERNDIEAARREQESNFLKTQNDNLEKFLRSFDTSKH